jgi:hypothetical protein
VIIDHCNLRKFLLNKILSRKETRWWEKLSDLDLLIKYRLDRSNFVDDLFRRSNYMIEKTLHVNQLILRNDEFSNQLKNNNRRLDEQSAISRFVKKISQVSLFSKTFDELRNDFINTQNSKSIASRAHVELIMRTRTLSSSSTEALVFAVNNAFQERLENRSFEIWKHHESQKRAFRLVKKKIDVSKQEIIIVVSQDIDIVDSFVKLRIILKILQESDQLAQEKWSHVATSTLKKREIEERIKNDRKMNNNRWHIKNDLLHYKKKYYIFSERFRRELFKQNHDDFQVEHFDYDKTLELLRKKYYWSLMSTNVREYIDSCFKCLQFKLTKHKSYEL